MDFPAVKGTFGEANVGSVATPFTLPGQDFQNYTLGQLNDGHKVVLAFFPAAFSAGAARGVDELLRDLNEHYADIQNAGYRVAAISQELPFVMEAFRKQMHLRFPVLSDASLEVSESYVGSFDLGAFLDGIGLSTDLTGYMTCNRAVVVIEQNGVISYKWIAKKDGKPHPGSEALYESFWDYDYRYMNIPTHPHNIFH